MTDRSADVLIVGGGLAGASCAEALRELGFDGSVVLAGREPQAPYERPPCSKDLLRGESTPEDALLHPAEWYAENDIELLVRTSVMKLDLDARTAALSTREELSFGKALLATGANVRRLRVDGGDLDGIHYLRALGNAASIRADAEGAERVVLIGGSYIACEVAASLTAMGKHCTLVMLEDAPLAGHFGEAAGGFFAGLLGEHGIECVTADPLARFEGDGPGAAGRDGVGPGARRRPRRDGHRRDARRHARPLVRARAGGDRRRALLADARDVGARACGRRRPVRVRLGRARAAAAGRALRGRGRAGPPRRRGDAGAGGALRARSPTSGPTSPTGARSSTSGRPSAGTARSSAAPSTPASSRSSTSTRAGSPPRSPSGARTTSSTPSG